MSKSLTYLVIDTVSDFAAFGIFKDAEPYYLTSISAPRRLLSELGSFLDRSIASSERLVESVDKVCVAVGPGSFSGSRIGVACAKTLAFSLDVEVLAFDHQEALGHRALNSNLNFYDSKWLAVVSDARRGQAHLLIESIADVGLRKLNRRSETLDIAEVERQIVELDAPTTIIGDLAPVLFERLRSTRRLNLGSEYLARLDPMLLGKYLIELDASTASAPAGEINVRYARDYDAKVNFQQLSKS